MHYAMSIVLRERTLGGEVVIFENAFGDLYQYNLRPLTTHPWAG